MERISWTEHVMSKEMLQHVNEKRINSTIRESSSSYLHLLLKAVIRNFYKDKQIGLNHSTVGRQKT